MTTEPSSMKIYKYNTTKIVKSVHTNMGINKLHHHHQQQQQQQQQNSHRRKE
jgi:hypothetical protein